MSGATIRHVATLEADFLVAMTAHRHTVAIPLRVSDYPILGRAQHDSSLKVMAFCAAEGKGRQDVAFPHQSEVKVNGGEVKANLRGLKNKPGSTRPVDITNDLRLKLPTYSNMVELTYALTNKASPHVSCQYSKISLHYFPSFCFPYAPWYKSPIC